jgi:cysteine desulfurase family protein
MIYFDNAATSWPKPPEVATAITNFITQVGANPGRSGHRLSVQASRQVFAAREAVAKLFHAPDPLRVVFGHNVTEALNLALHGYLRPGDHVVTSSMEHNSVMRPLRVLQSQGVAVTVVQCSSQGQLDPDDLRAALRPDTAMIVLNQASNVCGTLMPIAVVGEIAQRHGALLLVDTAQSAGAFPIDMPADGIDLLAFTGHKSLYGPMGTGGLVLGERVDLECLRALKQGGTGSRSEYEQQPDFLPDKYESGTLNAVGLAGLAAGIQWILDHSVEAIRAPERALTRRLLEGLTDMEGVTVYGCLDAAQQTATVSFNLQNLSPSEIGLRLDEEFEILCRVGLHCAPAAHQTLGTFPSGAVRFGLGAFNALAEVDAALHALAQLDQEAGR